MPTKRHGKTNRRGVKRPLPAIAGQADLLTEWREVGLITPSQFETFTRTSRSVAKES